MKKKVVWLILSCLMVLALVLASCGPAAEEAEEAKTVVGKVEEGKAEEEEEEEEEEAVAAKAEVPEYGGVLTVAGHLDMRRSFDPYKYYSIYTTHRMGSTVYEPLGIGDLRVGAGGTGEWTNWAFYTPTKYIRGLLAESWEVSPDGMTVTVHLKKGVRFQNKPPANGRELTAEDVKYCWDRRCGTGSGFTEPTPWNSTVGVKAMKEITVLDKYTLAFEAAYFNFEFARDVPIGYYTEIYPPEAITIYGDLEDWHNACGTGPFILTDYVEGSGFYFKKNPDYHGVDVLHPENRLPYYDELRSLVIPDASTRLAAIRTGKTDFTAYSTVDHVEKAQLEKTMSWQPQFGKRYVGHSVSLKPQMSTPPLDDLKVRQALYMGMNFQEIADILGGENTCPYGSVCNDAFDTDIYTPWDELPESVKEILTYNPEGARQLLAEAGYPDGFQTQVNLSTGSDTAIYEILARQWKEINVDLQIAMKDAAVISSIGSEGTWTGFRVILPGTATYRTCMYQLFEHQSYEVWCPDPRPKEEYYKIPEIVDEAERHAAFKALNMWVVENAFIITPRVGPPSFVVAQPWVKGWYGEYMMRSHDPASVYINFWIDRDLKESITGKR